MLNSSRGAEKFIHPSEKGWSVECVCVSECACHCRGACIIFTISISTRTERFSLSVRNNWKLNWSRRRERGRSASEALHSQPRPTSEPSPKKISINPTKRAAFSPSTHSPGFGARKFTLEGRRPSSVAITILCVNSWLPHFPSLHAQKGEIRAAEKKRRQNRLPPKRPTPGNRHDSTSERSWCCVNFLRELLGFLLGAGGWGEIYASRWLSRILRRL